MKFFQHLFKRQKRRGYALVIVLIFTAVGLLVLASFLWRTSTNGVLTQRNNAYFNAVEASEAATEKVISQLTSDFLTQGAATVNGKGSVYHAMKPSPSENARWNHFLFKDTHGNKNATEVDVISPWGTTPLISQYEGLSGYAETYRITSEAQDVNGGVTGAVQQDVQLATVPVFQFAIFYNLDMEICPGADMIIRGRVHSNNNIYMQPDGSQLTFLNDVTSAGDIIAGKSPDDPSSRNPGNVTFDAAHDSGVNSLNLPIGTNNTPAAVNAILQIPPNNESPNSQMGQQRLYNNADLIILVTDSGVTAHGGVANGNGPTLQWKYVKSFVNTNISFYNMREGKTVKTTQIDVGQLAAFNSTKNPLTQALGHDIQSVYVADQRTQSASTEPGVRLVNGQTLPPSGLTVATPDPLYVEGNYNVASSALGTSDTSQSKPAALIGDSINILSANWNDSNGNKSLSSRNATDTTVNAAFLGGIVPSGNGHYSGGVENFPRFLENWSGRTFTYNGSMVVMFPSQIATAPWGTSSVYNPPTRHWNFDVNFTDPNKLPPIGPAVRVVIRGNWTLIPPN